MIILQETFRKNNLSFKQVMRDGDIAMYSIHTDENASPVAYEVFFIKKIPETEIFGKMCPAHEICPSNEEFGKLGWSWCTLIQAQKCFSKLIADRTKNNTDQNNKAA